MPSSARFAASILIAIAAAGTVHLAGAEPPAATRPRPAPAGRLEQVFADPEHQLTGVAVSAKGRLFTNYPVWSPAHRYCVVEVVAGQARPYPDEAM
ncbi:MAG TPA: hypothetical protein VF469_21060, partial [Kofleriaceae bacterium]